MVVLSGGITRAAVDEVVRTSRRVAKRHSHIAERGTSRGENLVVQTQQVDVVQIAAGLRQVEHASAVDACEGVGSHNLRRRMNHSRWQADGEELLP